MKQSVPHVERTGDGGSEGAYLVVTPKRFLELLAAASEDDLSITHHVYGRPPTGWHSGPRTIPDHVLWHMIKGCFKGRAREEEVAVMPGTTYWLSPHVPHAVGTPAECAPLENYAIRFRLTHGGVSVRLRQDALPVVNLPRGRDMFDRLNVHLGSNLTHGFLRTRALLTDLFVVIFNEVERPGDGGSVFGPRDLERIQRYMEDHLADRPTPQDLADLFGLSLDYFSRRFKVHFGVPPRTWIQKERLRRAAAMLAESTLPVRDVAHHFAFEDPRFFSRQFKKAYGVSPSAYRRRR